MARDLGSLGIRVVTIASSLFATGLTAGVTEERAAGLTKDAAFPKRLGRPDEYAAASPIAIIENPMLNGDTRFAPTSSPYRLLNHVCVTDSVWRPTQSATQTWLMRLRVAGGSRQYSSCLASDSTASMNSVTMSITT